MSKFWDKVQRCKKHEETQNYFAHVPCGTPYCSGGSEWHCKHCGVYITEDPCGHTVGMSGWSYKRWRAKEKGQQLAALLGLN